VEKSLCQAEQTWWLPEQHRIRAELLLLTPGSETEAEIILWKALELARSQKSRSLELRSAMSLARLLRQEGRAAEGARPAGGVLCLVHRRIRHRGSSGGMGVAGGTDTKALMFWDR
jgi:hypothetical protein